MFLRHKIRRKDGKEHRTWSVVENRRVHDGRVVQRRVLYLGEIIPGSKSPGTSQKAAWSKAIEVFDEDAGACKQIALFPEDRVAAVLDCDVVSVRLGAMRLRCPRQYGACWLSPGSSTRGCCGISCASMRFGRRRCRPRARARAG